MQGEEYGVQGAEENSAERGPSTTPRRCWGRTRRLLGTGMSSDTENTETTHVLAGHHSSIYLFCVRYPLALPLCPSILSFVSRSLSLLLFFTHVRYNVCKTIEVIGGRYFISRYALRIFANSIMCVRSGLQLVRMRITRAGNDEISFPR